MFSSDMFQALELDMFQKKLKNAKESKISQKIFIEYKHTIMCEYFCIGFIDFMLKGKSLLHYTNLFCPSNYQKNDKIILKYFQWPKRLKIYCVICGKYRKFEKSKISYLLKKALVISVICRKCKNEEEEIFIEEESMEILKILGFIENILLL